MFIYSHDFYIETLEALIEQVDSWEETVEIAIKLGYLYCLRDNQLPIDGQNEKDFKRLVEIARNDYDIQVNA